MRRSPARSARLVRGVLFVFVADVLVSVSIFIYFYGYIPCQPSHDAFEAPERVPVSQQTLHHRLRESGLLASVDSSRQMVQVRRTIEGARDTSCI